MNGWDVEMDPQGEAVALNLILHLFRPAISIVYQFITTKTTAREHRIRLYFIRTN